MCTALEVLSVYVQGPFRIIPGHVDFCPPGMAESPFKDFNWRSYRDRNNVDSWVFWANITTLFTIDDSYDFDLNWASWSSRGGWKENAFIMRPGCFCKIFPLHNPEVWKRLMTVTFNDPNRKCPFPPGFYEIKNASTELSLKQIPIFFYGTWRVTLRLIKEQAQRATLCALLYGKTVPKY
ncbi:30S ribosomal protein S2 [Frankliniella fusca]|uniref:30S ribosomal protein S2 n=1 Tax=Frankliniella fusca TaxID=407009 RepID=A0AAE1LP53_9NEOP|nr:30S ribosomal protein S2 [Frankliniella fusca]